MTFGFTVRYAGRTYGASKAVFVVGAACLAEHLFRVLEVCFELFEERYQIHTVGECVVDTKGNGQHVESFPFAGRANNYSWNEHMLMNGGHFAVVEGIGDV